MYKIQELIDAEDALIKAHAKVRHLEDKKKTLKAELKALDNEIAIQLRPEKEALNTAKMKQAMSLSAWKDNPFACHRYTLSFSDNAAPIRASLWWRKNRDTTIWYLDFLDLTKTMQWETIAIQKADEEPITREEALLKADKILVEAGYNLTIIPPIWA